MRDGRYATSTRRPRQRYRCYPTGSGAFHRFTSLLPRDHVHVGTDACEECEELRGLHRGDQTVSRKQSWSSRLVAETLRDLARGATYADASLRMRKVTGHTRTRKPVPGSARPAYTGSRLAKNAWHIAADWCETFSPVLWARVEADLVARNGRDNEERERLALAGTQNPEPMMVLIDDVPINARFVDEDGANISRRDYFVLVVAEVAWGAAVGATTVRQLRLRLVRAYPTNDHHAWKLLFDELGYTPDFILADAGKGLMKAVADFYKGGVTFVPSLFHVRAAVEKGLFETQGAWVRASTRAPKELRGDVGSHLAGLRKKNLTTMTVPEWSAWWDDLEALLSGIGAPVEPTRRRRKNYEQAVAVILPTLATSPQLPVSTGGLEVAIRKRIEPMLANRAHAFANLEQTNRLFDLVVCDDHGLFDDMALVVSLLRTDSADHDGWSTPLRTVADRQPPKAPVRGKRYSSLRDQQLLRDITRAKGLA